MMPSVGEMMRSISTPNGSMPSVSSSRRAAARPWNLSKSPISCSRTQGFDLQREILDGLHVRQDADRNRDVEPVLDLQQQIHHLQRIEPEVAQQIRVLADLDPSLRARELGADLRQDLRILRA